MCEISLKPDPKKHIFYVIIAELIIYSTIYLFFLAIKFIAYLFKKLMKNRNKLSNRFINELNELVKSNQKWNCDKCTYINNGKDLHCIICYNPKIEIIHLPVQWQWHSALDNKWITYDLDTIIELENGYYNNKYQISLTKGYFKIRKNQYKVILNNNKIYYQLNIGSRMKRKVRRISINDKEIFKNINIKDISNDKCVICYSEFTIEDNINNRICQLKTCKNHGFHTKCIMQWIQLKAHCPLCKIELNV